MILKSDKTENGWITLTYQTTWRLYYEVMLCAAEEIIELDFKDKLGRLAVQEPGSKAIECLEDYHANGNDLRECTELTKEHGSIIVSGYSSIMECPLQITLYNQTNVVTLQTNSLDYIEKYGREVFTNYINSIEIKTYVRDTANSFPKQGSFDEDTIKKLPFAKKLKLLFGK